MGVVYRARHGVLGKPVALKVLHPGGSPDEVARFLQEARAMAEMSHPNIVPVHDIGQAGATWYIAMDLVSGGTLAGLVRERRAAPPERRGGPCVPLDRALALVEKVARAVHHAHGRGIIHRDLKPSNVLLRSDDEPLVADFGIARRRETPRALTHTGQVLGTPAYMAPEQAESAAHADERADVYALGAILYELLTGEPPLETTGLLAHDLVRVVSHDPVPPRRRVPSLARDVETIVLRALAREPERRYPSAEALADDIRRYREGEAILARRPSLLERARLFARRRRTALVSGAAGALLAAVLVTTGATLLWPGAPGPPGWETVYERARFEPADLADWRPSSGRWRVEDGALVAESPSGADLTLAAPVAGDVRVSYTATLRPRDPSAGDLSLALLPAGASREGPKDEGRQDYFFGFGSNGNTNSKLMRGARRLSIAEGAEARIVPGRAHEVVCERAGGALRLEVDGRAVLEHRDLFPLSFARGAEVVLYAWVGEARFARVKVERRAPRPETDEAAALADFVFEKGDHAAAARLYASLAEHPALAPLERAEARLKEGLARLEDADAPGLAEGERAARRARARGIFEGLAADRASGEMAARALLGSAEADLREGRIEAALARAGEALRGAASGPARQAVRDFVDRGEARLAARGETDARMAWLRGGLALFPGEPTRAVEARLVESRLLAETGRFTEAAALLEAGVPEVAGHGFLAPRLLTSIGTTLARGGDMAGARAAFARAEEAAGANDFARTEALTERAAMELERGDPRLALAAVDAARALPRAEARDYLYPHLVLRALAELRLAPPGAPAEARAEMRARLDALALEGLGGGDRGEALAQEYAVLGALGAALDRLAHGEEAEARARLGRALLWRRAGVYDEAGAWALAVALDLRAGDASSARALLRGIAEGTTRYAGVRALAAALADGRPPAEAAALLERCRGAHDRAVARLALAADAAARGDAAAARSHLASLEEDVRAGAPPWIAEVARRMAP
jgi:tRNA A-37 threonylcarbamoyl transferase component Bud32